MWCSVLVYRALIVEHAERSLLCALSALSRDRGPLGSITCQAASPDLPISSNDGRMTVIVRNIH